MRPEVREWAERQMKDVPPLTDEQIRKLSLVIGPVVRRKQHDGPAEAGPKAGESRNSHGGD